MYSPYPIWATARSHAASSASGRPEDDGLKRPTHKTFSGFVGKKTARLMTIGRNLLIKAETVMVAPIQAGVPTLAEPREIINQFHLMIRCRLETGFAPWMSVRASLIASFASGVEGVRAAITSP